MSARSLRNRDGSSSAAGGANDLRSRRTSVWNRNPRGYFEGRRAKVFFKTMKLIHRVGVAPDILTTLAYWVLRPRRSDFIVMAEAPRECRSGHDSIAAWHDSTRDIPADLLGDCYTRIGALTGMDSTWKVLDVNCGTSRLSTPLMDSGYEVTGIDSSSAMLEQANSQLQTGWRGSFVHGDATRIQFPENSFDVVIISRLFLNIGNAAQVTKELKRILRPGGIVIVVHGKNAFDSTPRRDFRELCDERGYLPQRHKGDRYVISSVFATLNMTHLQLDVSDLKWTKTMMHRESIEHLRLRVHAEFWLVPPIEYDQMLGQVQEKLARQPGGLETEDVLNPTLEVDLYVMPEPAQEFDIRG